MNIRIINTFIILSILIASKHVQALTCLQAPSRIEACPNIIYRSVEDPLTNKTILFCYCKKDFDLLLKNDVTDAQRISNQMQWRQILISTGYSDQQLKKLLKR